MNSDFFFVYGTLKRDRLRGSAWPHTPLSVRNASVTGTLLDLGSYPGLLLNGDSTVLGEIWEIAQSDCHATLQVLDAIECYSPGSSNNLYQRVRHPVMCDGSFVECWVYEYRQSTNEPDVIIHPTGEPPVCEWTKI